jgi:hypothetical protein
MGPAETDDQGALIATTAAGQAPPAGREPKAGRAARRVAAASGTSGTIERPTRTRRPASAWAAQTRTELIVGVLGNKQTAELLNVSQSQPSRWRTGAETPGVAVAPLLVDLDHVIARLLILWDRSVVFDWLTGPNGFLDGARPIDVIAARGTTEVIEAIEAEAGGAYA